MAVGESACAVSGGHDDALFAGVEALVASDVEGVAVVVEHDADDPRVAQVALDRFEGDRVIVGAFDDAVAFAPGDGVGVDLDPH